MVRITVSTEAANQDAASTHLDERVNSVHLDRDDNAAEFIERLGWAITDAETAQPGKPGH
jgi:hypothetical protein